MLTRTQLLGLGLAGLLACGVAFLNQEKQPIKAKTPVETAVTEKPATHEAPSSEPSDYERELNTHIQQLTRLQTMKESRDFAASKMAESRRFLAQTYHPQWLNLLATNWPAFMELRQQAARTPTRETPCTLCDGNGFESFCILCPEREGKCVSCRGSGHITSEEICPTCLGNGKCYLCFGSGKMLCPFCNNGVIEFRRPSPLGCLPTN